MTTGPDGAAAVPTDDGETAFWDDAYANGAYIEDGDAYPAKWASAAAGFRQAMTDAGEPVDESVIAYGDFSEASGAEAMRTLLDRHPDLDAVFCASDLMAVGAMRMLTLVSVSL